MKLTDPNGSQSLHHYASIALNKCSNFHLNDSSYIFVLSIKLKNIIKILV